MGEVSKDVQYTKLWGNYVPLPQHEKADGTMVQTGENNPLPAEISSSKIIQPTEVQARYSQTVQVLNGQSVAPNGAGVSSTWLDTDGFDKIACTCRSNTALNGRFQFIWSNDGTNTDSYELPSGTGISNSGTGQFRNACVDTKARFVKIEFDNMDASNPQTVTAYAFLKA